MQPVLKQGNNNRNVSFVSLFKEMAINGLIPKLARELPKADICIAESFLFTELRLERKL
jgi:hypothetical protein